MNVSKYDKEKLISVSDKNDLESSAWDIFENIIYAKQYIPIYGNTRYTDKNYVTLSNITVNNPYIVNFDNGLDGLLGFDVSYIENYSETVSNNGSYKDTHVVLSLNTEVYDEIVTIENETAFELGKEIAKQEGVLVGISSGAALAAAIEVAKRPESKGKTIVALLPDSGDRYYSTDLFRE